jgi:inhibitor of KinA
MPRFPRIVPLGDSGLTVEFAPRIDLKIHEHVLACAAALENHPLPGQIEVVPTYRSITVYYDPGCANNRTLTTRLRRIATKPERTIRRRAHVITVPVLYTPEVAPDLEAVADETHLTVEEVVRRHTRRVYRVYMLGFMPGFPYLGKVADRIAVPRLATPRLVVPAGSVGIAGHQTGIYPRASPGGWRIIGRTPIPLCDVRRSQPFLLKTGDRVRFRSIDREEFMTLSARLA